MHCVHTYTDQEYDGDRYKEYSVAKYLFVMAIIHTRRRWNRINKHEFPPHVLFVLGEPVEPGGGGVVRDGGVDHTGLLLPPPVRGPGREGAGRPLLLHGRGFCTKPRRDILHDEKVNIFKL